MTTEEALALETLTSSRGAVATMYGCIIYAIRRADWFLDTRRESIKHCLRLPVQLKRRCRFAKHTYTVWLTTLEGTARMIKQASFRKETLMANAILFVRLEAIEA